MTNAPTPPSSRRILITGFEPFDGAERNPSWDLAEQLRTRAEAGELTAQAEAEAPLTLETLLLPVEYEAAGTLLRTRLDELTAAGDPPELVIALGLAGGTAAVRLERVGINLRDARIPDNAGAQPADQPVVVDGDGALFSTLRVKAAAARITAAGIPVELSLSAGTFVCNDVLYTLLAHLLDHRRRTESAATRSEPAASRGGFVHVPDLHAEDAPLTLDQAAQAVDLIIAESLRPEPDADTPGGTLH